MHEDFLITPGIYKNIDIDVYHKSPGLSSTGVSLILDCPARYNHVYNIAPLTLSDTELQKEKEKYKTGRMLHMLVLEPLKFFNLYYVANKTWDLRTKLGKQVYEEVQLLAGGREIIKQDEFDELSRMAANLQVTPVRHLDIWKELETLNIEDSICWNSGLYETFLRSRPDLYTSDLIIDVKTTCNIKQFDRSAYNYGYHRQAAMQIDSLYAATGKMRDFYLMVVETKAPYLTKIYHFDADSLELGRREYLKAAEIYSECLLSDTWPGYNDASEEIKLPKYMFNNEILLEEIYVS